MKNGNVELLVALLVFSSGFIFSQFITIEYSGLKLIESIAVIFASFATIGALWVAFVAYRNWKKPAVFNLIKDAVDSLEGLYVECTHARVELTLIQYLLTSNDDGVHQLKSESVERLNEIAYPVLRAKSTFEFRLLPVVSDTDECYKGINSEISKVSDYNIDLLLAVHYLGDNDTLSKKFFNSAEKTLENIDFKKVVGLLGKLQDDI